MNTITVDAPEPNAAELKGRRVPPSSRSLVVRLAERFSVDPDKLMGTLKATAFRQRPDKTTGQVRTPTDEEMMALLIIADQYRLNPFTKELFAYFDPKSGAIIPVVSVDGWIRIINEQPTLRSLSFNYSPETVKHRNKVCHVWMECVIARSDRDLPIVIREYFAEVVRDVDFSTPWDSHPNRMHRHKTLIQGGRVAFGFGGIYDEDEAQRIIEGEASRTPEPASAGIAAINARIENKPGETIPAVVGEQSAMDPIQSSAEDAATREGAEPTGSGNMADKPAPESVGPSSAAAPETTIARVLVAINAAANVDELNVARDLARGLKDRVQQRQANIAAEDKRRALESAKP